MGSDDHHAGLPDVDARSDHEIHVAANRDGVVGSPGKENVVRFKSRVVLQRQRSVGGGAQVCIGGEFRTACAVLIEQNDFTINVEKGGAIGIGAETQSGDGYIRTVDSHGNLTERNQSGQSVGLEYIAVGLCQADPIGTKYV